MNKHLRCYIYEETLMVINGSKQNALFTKAVEQENRKALANQHGNSQAVTNNHHGSPPTNDCS